jgi:carbonic anhydrase
VNVQPGGRPLSAAEARDALVAGNHAFTRFLDEHPLTADGPRPVMQIALEDLGLSRPGTAPSQRPFAAFLGCADARVPVEIIFGQAANDVFVVRVAGNVLGAECLGSLDFAVEQLGTVRLLGVLGHTGCGAVTAAVDAFLVPSSYLGVAANLPLTSIVSGLLAPVRAAIHALHAVYGEDTAVRPGYRAAIIDLSVALNAALVAAVLRRNFPTRKVEQQGVVYGVYNLATRSVGAPNTAAAGPVWHAGLFDPPQDEAGFAALADQLARSRYVGAMLDE